MRKINNLIRPDYFNSDRREKHLADGEKRAAEFSPRLPKGPCFALHVYSLSAQARANSKYLDGLLAFAKPTGTFVPVEPEPERLRAGARHRINGWTI
jgi:hypothetical protein